jgi:hypothetical protein
MMKSLLICTVIAGTLGLVAGARADDGKVQLGSLSCHEASGWGFVFGSSRALHCTFSGVDGKVAHYDGSINKFGVDIGYQQAGVLVWEVLAPSDHADSGAIAGHYGGVSAKATVGVGAGVNVLIGGSEKSISLQPVSVEGATGLNVAAGIGEMTLKSHAGG